MGNTNRLLWLYGADGVDGHYRVAVSAWYRRPPAVTRGCCRWSCTARTGGRIRPPSWTTALRTQSGEAPAAGGLCWKPQGSDPGEGGHCAKDRSLGLRPRTQPGLTYSLSAEKIGPCRGGTVVGRAMVFLGDDVVGRVELMTGAWVSPKTPVSLAARAASWLTRQAVRLRAF